jgi:hypothetical protein
MFMLRVQEVALLFGGSTSAQLISQHRERIVSVQNTNNLKGNGFLYSLGGQALIWVIAAIVIVLAARYIF